MEEILQTLTACSLFAGIEPAEIAGVLTCLSPRRQDYERGQYILHAGDCTDCIGLVLSGSVFIMQEDIWGNRNIVSSALPGQTFAAAFACAESARLNVSCVAEDTCSVLFLDVRRVLTTCSNACEHHSRIIRNLLGELAKKDLQLNEKLTHMGQRTTRGKLMSYFSSQVRHCGSREFDIPFSRQQLADYLAVERSGLSLELGKMRDEGILEFYKNSFRLLR